MKRENAWKKYNSNDIAELESLSGRYIDFLSRCKTERECVKEAVSMAEAHGYVALDGIIASGRKVKAGDKIYAVCMNKAIAMFNIGEEPLEKGMNILGAHIDSPRIDVKQNPLYEKGDLALLDTHYYGGIKKYQWVTLPLAIHGVIVKKDGTTVEINIGEKEDDPVFCISDLLIHLASDQMTKTAAKVVEGEDLDVIVGSIPAEEKGEGKCVCEATAKTINADGNEAGKEAGKATVTNGILNILKEKYGVEEEDFMSAELEIVPSGKAREMGMDRSMVLSYGQDDRVCAYTSLEAMLAESDTADGAGNAAKTSCLLLVDKEEIGSVGATGMQSKFFENTVAEILNLAGEYSELSLKRCLASCRMLSSDVNAGFDPLYAGAFSDQSASYLGRGVVFNKFTGARGKSGSNDANAEYLAAIRKIMDDNNVSFQMAELGKVDVGGGGTIAYIMSLYGMEVIDCGVAVLNMHAPWEITSKADIYETYKCYRAFLKDA